MYLSQEELLECTEGVLHEPTQLKGSELHLTVNSISGLSGTGDLDFGGGERDDAEISNIVPEKRSRQDEYGWWNLTEGQYLIGFNEDIVLSENTIGVLQPLPRLTRNGSYHPSVSFQQYEERPMLMMVGKGGINLKENARVTALKVWRKKD